MTYRSTVAEVAGQTRKRAARAWEEEMKELAAEGFRRLADLVDDQQPRGCIELELLVQPSLSVGLGEGDISGIMRYEVLKRAQFHFALCGISADIGALEVDHIQPRNKGGTDDPVNLQALCYSCNSMRRDRDATDFRAIRDSYAHKEDDCPFCHLERCRVVEENEMAIAFRDLCPTTPLHTLVIPKRHVVDYFAMSRFEVKACDLLLRSQKDVLQNEDRSIRAFNIGVNVGAIAGQTVFHSHIHLIPRRAGDVEKPRGGVRNVVPGKGSH